MGKHFSLSYKIGDNYLCQINMGDKSPFPISKEDSLVFRGNNWAERAKFSKTRKSLQR